MRRARWFFQGKWIMQNTKGDRGIQISGVTDDWIIEIKSGSAHPEKAQTLVRLQIARDTDRGLRIVFENPNIDDGFWYAALNDALAVGFDPTRLEVYHAPYQQGFASWQRLFPNQDMLDRLGITYP
jgi:hypothetical protein